MAQYSPLILWGCLWHYLVTSVHITSSKSSSIIWYWKQLLRSLSTLISKIHTNIQFFLMLSVCVCVCVCVCACMLSHVWLFATPWTVACQALLSMGFHRQEYWSGLPCPPPSDFPTQRSNPCILCLLYWQTNSLSLAWSGKPITLLLRLSKNLFVK